MIQYKIPQNIGIEDKIVGPFSLRQLIILAIGGGISYVLFVTGSKLYELNVIEYVVIAIPALFALAAAMLKIRNVSFIKFILLTLEFAIKPKKRMWDHRGISGIVDPDLSDKISAKKPTKSQEEGNESRKNVNLNDLSSLLDSGGFDHVQKVAHEDIDEAEDDDLITEAYFGHKRSESSTENMYWRTKEMQKKKLEILAKIPKTPAKVEPTPSQAPEKKETVTEHLAKVIQEAKQKNQSKNEELKEVEEIKEVKKVRKRKKKSINGAVRQNTQIDSTTKKAPVKMVEKTTRIQTKPIVENETSFGDLKQGGEIEFNLD